jgi:hypothetical protein
MNLLSNLQYIFILFLIISILPNVVVGQGSDQIAPTSGSSTEVAVSPNLQSNVNVNSNVDVYTFVASQPVSPAYRQPYSENTVDLFYSPLTSNYSVLSPTGQIVSTFDPIDLLAPQDTLQALSIGPTGEDIFDIVAIGSNYPEISDSGHIVFRGQNYFLNGERVGAVYICEICYPEAEIDAASDGLGAASANTTTTLAPNIGVSIPQSFIHTYGRVTVVNPLTLEIERDELIAYTPEAFLYAQERGFDVRQEYSDMVHVAQIPIPATWKISADAVETTSGEVLIATSENSSVTINNGSVVFAAGQRNGSSGTTIFSSDNTLYIGDSDQHRTVVRGTLEVNDPTAPNHATTRRYVDAMGALSMAMATLPTPAPGQSMLGYSVSQINGENAFAVGFSHVPQLQSWAVRFNFGYSRATGAGGAIGFGHQW